MILSVMTIALFVILAVLWTTDTVETCELVNREGIDVEENPVAKFFLKLSNRDFILFKVFDLAMLGTILYYISHTNMLAANTLLFIFTLVYAFTVVHNYIIIEKYAEEDR
ncbi:MAG: hypothetical protein KAI18_04215 [Candidatus Aenigmarchaeota archaeon]|nr:hypothetical protein [Candidatus Aenigmarchaeota archaeon]